MREILFRGRAINPTAFSELKDGDWLEGDLSQSRHRGYRFIANVDCGTVEVEPETIGQFTGLTDKNGVKIFEGDKIYINGMYLGYILLTDGAFNLIEENNQSGSNIINQARMNRMEIIGNIHEGDK